MLVLRRTTQADPAWFPEIVAVYRAAFAPPPYRKGEEEVFYFERMLPEHAERPGFCMIAALLDDRLVGYAYGYTCAPHYYWTTLVRKWMEPAAADYWLADAFQLAEIAVLPGCQGMGIGGSLHDRILEGQPNRTAVLSTMAAESNALHLYHRRGWVTLVETFIPPGMTRPYRVMGKELLPEKAANEG